MPIEQPMPDNQYSLQSRNHRCLRRNERIHRCYCRNLQEKVRKPYEIIKVQRYSTETELSKYACCLKEERKPFTIKWSVFKRVVLLLFIRLFTIFEHFLKNECEKYGQN